MSVNNTNNFIIADLVVPALALSDHMSRLYEGNWHVDNEACIVFGHTTKGKHNVSVELTYGAALEFLADMEYQIEFSDGAYRAQCRRAYKAVKERLANEVTTWDL